MSYVKTSFSHLCPQGQVYLDHAATSPILAKEAELFVQELQEIPWNSSAAYDLGLRSKKALEEARSQIALDLGVCSNDLVFTSGGTESNNLALQACTRGMPAARLWQSRTLHPSMSEPISALDKDVWEICPLPVLSGGSVDLQACKRLQAPDVLVIEWVNNEMGFIQPLEELMALARAMNAKVRMVVDGAQALGKLPMLPVKSLHALTFSGHKLGAPVGVGGLYLSPALLPTPMLRGGGQERGWRSGTVAVPLIRSLARVLHNAIQSPAKPFAFPRIDDGDHPKLIRAEACQYTPHIVALDTRPVEGEVLMHHLAEEGIYLSTGSACSAHKRGGSATHRAVGLDDRASRCILRWSHAHHQSEKDLLLAWNRLVYHWRELKRFFRST